MSSPRPTDREGLPNQSLSVKQVIKLVIISRGDWSTEDILNPVTASSLHPTQPIWVADGVAAAVPNPVTAVEVGLVMWNSLVSTDRQVVTMLFMQS